MKFKALIAVAVMALSTLSAQATETKPTHSVQMSEFTPFGVTQNSDLEALGCSVYQDDLYECKNFPEKNTMFPIYAVETRSGPREGICNVTAYSQVFRGDRNGFQVTRAFDKLSVLLSRKYGNATKTVELAPTEVDGYMMDDQFAAALDAGVKEFSKEWSNIPGKLPSGTSIKMKMVANSDEKTFVELNYFFGGPGCETEEDQSLQGL